MHASRRSRPWRLGSPCPGLDRNRQHDVAQAGVERQPRKKDRRRAVLGDAIRDELSAFELPVDARGGDGRLRASWAVTGALLPALARNRRGAPSSTATTWRSPLLRSKPNGATSLATPVRRTGLAVPLASRLCSVEAWATVSSMITSKLDATAPNVSSRSPAIATTRWLLGESGRDFVPVRSAGALVKLAVSQRHDRLTAAVVDRHQAFDLRRRIVAGHRAPKLPFTAAQKRRRFRLTQTWSSATTAMQTVKPFNQTAGPSFEEVSSTPLSPSPPGRSGSCPPMRDSEPSAPMLNKCARIPAKSTPARISSEQPAVESGHGIERAVGKLELDPGGRTGLEKASALPT